MMIEYIYAGIVGLLIGSFLNVVALRTPKRMMWQWRRDALEFLDITDTTYKEMLVKENKQDVVSSETSSNISMEDENQPAGVVKKRSHCFSCGNTISWYDNIPVLSYLFLKGKCRNCKSRISWQYPLVELASGILAVCAVVQFGLSLEAVALYGFFAVCLVLTVIDFRTQLLPDDIVLPSLWIALAWSVFAPLMDAQALSPSLAIVGACVGYLSLWSVYWGFKLVTGKEGMGYGDFKLLALIGAFLGPSYILSTLVVATVVGLIVGTVLLRKKGESQPFAFGPYLALGGIVCAMMMQFPFIKIP